jgi:hypothetical protein
MADFGRKFAAIQSYVTPETLALINKSETLKEQFRSYQIDNKTDNVVLDSTGKLNAASYTLPSSPTDTVAARLGQATFGSNTISTPEKFITVVSHELGHHDVEGPNSLIGNARANTAANKDANGYEAACHLTEGYARLATAKVIDEITSQTPANAQEALLMGSLKSETGYKEYKSLQSVAAQTSWTSQEMDSGLAFALGDSNRTQKTSTENMTYLAFCKNEGDKVNASGITPAAGALVSLRLAQRAWY